MTIRTLTAKVEADTTGFTRGMGAAGRSVLDLDKITKAASSSTAGLAQALGGSTEAVRAYLAANKSLKITQSELRVAQNQYLQGLVRELDTMGMNTAQLRAYEAAQLKLTGATRALINEINRKEAALASEASFTAAVTAAENTRRASADALVVGLREQIITIQGGSDALTMHRAAQMGVAQEAGELLAVISALNATREREVAATLAAKEAEEAATAAKAQAVAATLAQREAGDAMIANLERELFILRNGTEAWEMRQATQLDVAPTVARLRGEINQLKEAQREEAQATREATAATRGNSRAKREALTPEQQLRAEIQRQIDSMKHHAIRSKEGAAGLAAFKAQTLGVTGSLRPMILELKAAEAAMGGLGRAGHMNSRALTEINVLSHELSSGRYKQAITSFSIFLQALGMAAPATIAITVALGLLYTLNEPLQEAAEHFEEMNHQAQQLGVSIEYLQTLAAAADLVDLKTFKLVGGFGRMNLALERARMGSERAQKAFTALGIDISKTMSNEELIDAFLAGWAKLDDGFEKNTVINALMGRSGRDLIPVMNKLSKEFDEIASKTEKYGLTTQEAVFFGTNLAQSYRQTELAGKGLGATLVGELGPALLAMSTGTTNVIMWLGMFIRHLDTVIGNAKILGAGLLSVAGVMAAAAIPQLLRYVGAMVAASTTIQAMSIALMSSGGLSAAFSVAATAAAPFLATMATVVLPIALVVGFTAALLGMNQNLGNARHAMDDFKKANAGAVSALYDAISFSREFGLSTDSLSGAIDTLTGAQSAGNKKTDEATQLTLQLANAQRILAADALRAAAAVSLSTSKKAGAAINDFTGLKNQITGNEIFTAGRAAFSMLGTPSGGFDRAAKAIQEGRKRKQELEGLIAEATVAEREGKKTAALLLAQAEQMTAKPITAADLARREKPAGDTSFEPEDDDDKKGKGASPKADAELSKIGNLLGQLEGQLASVDAEINDTGSNYAKYAAILADANSPLGKAVAKHSELKDKILESARALDEANERLEGKKAFEKLTEQAKESNLALSGSRLQLKDFVTGASEASVATAKYEAGLADLVEETKKFGDAQYSSAQATAAQMVENFKAQRELDESVKTLTKWRQEQVQAKEAGDDLWRGIVTGTISADRSLEKLQARLRAYIETIKDPEAHEAAKQLAAQFETDAARERNLTALSGMIRETETMERGRVTDRIQRLRQQTQFEIEERRKLLNFEIGSTEEQKKAIEEFEKWKAAKWVAADAQSTFGRMKEEWSDAIGNMKEASAGWINSFVDGLASGKMNFAEFTNAIIADIAKIIIRAMIAKYVLQPLMNMFGLNVAPSGSIPTVVAHTGAIIGSGEGTLRMANPNMFKDAIRYHQGGEVGLRPGEVPAILQRGEGVFTQGQMKALAGGTQNAGVATLPPIQINLVNQSGTQLDADQGGQKFDGEKYIIDTVLSNLGRPGPLRNAIKNQQ